MKTFYLMWTYVANFGGPWERQAESAEQAAQQLRQGFSEDFRKRGTVYVFTEKPVLVVNGDVVNGDVKDK